MIFYGGVPFANSHCFRLDNKTGLKLKLFTPFKKLKYTRSRFCVSLTTQLVPRCFKISWVFWIKINVLLPLNREMFGGKTVANSVVKFLGIFAIFSVALLHSWGVCSSSVFKRHANQALQEVWLQYTFVVAQINRLRFFCYCLYNLFGI